MITCRQCHTTHTPFNADIRFVKCACGAVINNDGTTANIKRNAITQSTPSFFKRGQKGNYRGKAFEIIGRVNVWNEDSILNYWTLLFEDSATLLLEEGYGNYALLHREGESGANITTKQKYPPNARISLGKHVALNVDINAKVIYIDVEGQTTVWTIDPDNILNCSSIYNTKLYEIWNDEKSQDVFLVTGVEFEDLNIAGAIDEELQFTKENIASCERCSNTFPVAYFPYVQTAACPKCTNISAFDIQNRKWDYVFPNKTSIKQSEEEELPIGTKVILLGDTFEIIGKAYKRNQQDYNWLEYHLYNAFEGSFAYLSESEGHFILLYELFDPPKYTDNYKNDLKFFNRTFRSYDIYQAEITRIEGNLVGAYGNPRAQVRCFDYVAAPYMLSLELGADNANYWHFGEYVPKGDVQKVFNQVQKRRPKRSGYGAARPANKLSLSAILMATAIMCLIYFVIQVWMEGQNTSQVITQQRHTIDATTKQVTIDDIHINEQKTEINIDARADVNNDWLVLNYNLINKANGREVTGGQEIAYYQGYEDGESWSEGSQQNGYKFSGVDKGNYKLVVELEHNPERINEVVPLMIQVRTDGSLGKNFWLPFFLLIGWAVWAIIKYFAVESFRFSEE